MSGGDHRRHKDCRGEPRARMLGCKREDADVRQIGASVTVSGLG